MMTCTKGSQDCIEDVDNTQTNDKSNLGESSATLLGAPNLQEDTDIRNSLGKCLSTKWISPDMAFAKHIQNPINPGIFVTDAETIGLPLSYRDAKAIFDICDIMEKSNSESVEEKVRTAWTLPPNSIRFQNPTFKAWVVESAKEVLVGLRILGRVKSDSIRAHFSGMVLQPPCASNESLRLTTTTGNAFAMMAIVLPTAHTGGTVEFMSGEDVKQYATSEASAYGCSLLSWLSNSDVEVILGSVESGCRVMLTYDLFSTEKVDFPSPVSAQNTHELLYKTLVDLKRHPEASGKIPGVFAHVLKHTPKIQFPIYDALDTLEKDLIRVLQCVCSEIGVLLYLANIQRKVTGSGLNAEKQFEMDTIASDSVQLKEVFDFDGTQIAQFVKIEEQNLVRDISETFGDWASNGTNEAGEVSLIYDRVAVLFIVPSCYPALLLNPENKVRIDANQWLSQAIHTAENTPPDHISREQLRYGCRLIMNEYKAYLDGTRPNLESPFFDEDISLVIKASILTGELDLSFGLESLTPESYLEIGTFISVHGFAAVQNSLSVGMSKLRNVCARRLVLNEIETNVLVASTVHDPLVENSMGVWRENQAKEALRDCIYETSEDAYSLILMAKRHGPHFLLTKILPTVKQHVTSTSFVLHLLNHLALGISELNISRATVRLSYQILLPEITPSLLLLSAEQKNSEKKYKSCRLTSGPKSEHSSTQYARPEQIAEIVCNCLEFNVGTGLEAVIRQLLDEESAIKPSDYTNVFHKIYLPFLKHLLGLIKELQTWKNKTHPVLKDVPEFQQNPSIKKLFQKLLKRHLRRLNTPEPPLPDNPTNWVKPKKGCDEESCRDCKKLDRFLQDPLKKHEQFKVSAPRRKHIEQQVRGSAAEGIPKTEFRFKVLHDPYPGVLIVEKTHKDWESNVLAWSQKCNMAMNMIEQEIVSEGGAELLGGVLVLIDDLRELIEVKLKVTELCKDLCVKESRWANLSTGR